GQVTGQTGAMDRMQPIGAQDRHAAVPDESPAGTGFALFDTAIGHCGIAWNERVLTGLLLSEGDEAATRRRMRRLHPGLAEVSPRALPPLPRMAIARIAALLRGERDDLS